MLWAYIISCFVSTLVVTVASRTSWLITSPQRRTQVRTRHSGKCAGFVNVWKWRWKSQHFVLFLCFLRWQFTGILSENRCACCAAIFMILNHRVSLRCVHGSWIKRHCTNHALHHRGGLCQGHHSRTDGLVLLDGGHVYHWCWSLCSQDPWALFSWQVWHLGKCFFVFRICILHLHWIMPTVLKKTKQRIWLRHFRV